MVILLQRIDKTKYRFLVTSECLLSRKALWAVRISGFWQKNQVFYRPEWTKGGDYMKMNFDYFQIPKWMLQTERKKVDGKNGVICLVSMILFCIMVLKLSIKMHFCNFVLNPARNLSLLMQFTYVHLKDLVMHFQKMALFILLWLNVSEILGFEVKEVC